MIASLPFPRIRHFLPFLVFLHVFVTATQFKIICSLEHVFRSSSPSLPLPTQPPPPAIPSPPSQRSRPSPALTNQLPTTVRPFILISLTPEDEGLRGVHGFRTLRFVFGKDRPKRHFRSRETAERPVTAHRRAIRPFRFARWQHFNKDGVS